MPTGRAGSRRIRFDSDAVVDAAADQPGARFRFDERHFVQSPARGADKRLASRWVRRSIRRSRIDASAADSLSSRGLRALVSVAGMLAELSIAVLAILAWVWRVPRVVPRQQTAGRMPPPVDLAVNQLPSGAEFAPLVSRLASQTRLHRIIDSFIDSLAIRLTPMQSELDSEGVEALSQSAHWLKGSAGSVGFDTVTEPARELERCALDNDRAGASLATGQIMHMAERMERVTADAALTALRPPFTGHSVHRAETEA